MVTKKSPDNTYVIGLIDLLRPHTNGLSRQSVLADLEAIRKSNGLAIPPKFEQAVQGVFNLHSIDSEVFRTRKRPEEGFFRSVRHANTAVWSVNLQLAEAWLRTQSPHYELAQAIGRIKGVPTEKALVAVEDADDDKRKEWRSNAMVKAVLAEIRAEKAMQVLEREEREALSIELPPNETGDQ